MSTIPGYLGKLIDEGEHQQLDFKFAINDSRKIAASLSAFANTDGGRLLVGVKDNGRVAGVRSEEEFYMIQAAAEMYCQPPVVFETQSWEWEGKTVLEVYIPPSRNRPHKAKNHEGKWLAYIRIADENILASPVHLSMWTQTAEKGAHFSDDEALVLKTITLHSSLTINQLSKKTQIDRQKIIPILANLCRWKLLRIQREKDRFVFTIFEAI